MFLFLSSLYAISRLRKKQHTYIIVSFQYAKVHSKPFHFHEKTIYICYFLPSISEMARRRDSNAINLYIKITQLYLPSYQSSSDTVTYVEALKYD